MPDLWLVGFHSSHRPCLCPDCVMDFGNRLAEGKTILERCQALPFDRHGLCLGERDRLEWNFDHRLW